MLLELQKCSIMQWCFWEKLLPLQTTEWIQYRHQLQVSYCFYLSVTVYGIQGLLQSHLTLLIMIYFFMNSKDIYIYTSGSVECCTTCKQGWVCPWRFMERWWRRMTKTVQWMRYLSVRVFSLSSQPTEPDYMYRSCVWSLKFYLSCHSAVTWGNRLCNHSNDLTPVQYQHFINLNLTWGPVHLECTAE